MFVGIMLIILGAFLWTLDEHLQKQERKKWQKKMLEKFEAGEEIEIDGVLYQKNYTVEP